MKEVRFAVDTRLERKDIKGAIDDWVSKHVTDGHVTVELDYNNVSVNIFVPPDQSHALREETLNELKAYLETLS